MTPSNHIAEYADELTGIISPVDHIAAHGDKMIAEVIIYAGYRSNVSMFDNAKILAAMRCDDIIKVGNKQVGETFRKVKDYIINVRPEDKAVAEQKERHKIF